jgi:hypothetical protein
MEGTMADVPERIWLEPGPYGWRLGGPGGARGFESEPYVTLGLAEAMAAEARREALEAAAERLRNYIEQAHYYGRGITPTTAADLQILAGRIRALIPGARND